MMQTEGLQEQWKQKKLNGQSTDEFKDGNGTNHKLGKQYGGLTGVDIV